MTMSNEIKNEKVKIMEPPPMKRISPIKYNFNIEELNRNYKKRKLYKIEDINI